MPPTSFLSNLGSWIVNLGSLKSQHPRSLLIFFVWFFIDPSSSILPHTLYHAYVVQEKRVPLISHIGLPMYGKYIHNPTNFTLLTSTYTYIHNPNPPFFAHRCPSLPCYTYQDRPTHLDPNHTCIHPSSCPSLLSTYTWVNIHLGHEI